MSIVILQHSPSTGAMRLAAALRDYGHRLRVIELHAGAAVPSDLDDTDGIIATGGNYSANNNEPWLEPEMKLLAEADAAQLPVVGICLGSQVLARALGGEVSTMDGGIELGWHEVALTPVGAEDPLFAGIAWTSMQFHWHQDEVSKMPDGARVLATSQRCQAQAWAHGLRSYGFQYHPEVYADTAEAWAGQDPDDLQKAGITLDELQTQTAEHYPTFERLSTRLFESIAMLLVPSDRRYKGLVKDLHH
jgi:GMP synthase-like glutamine amidotransferase